MSTISTYRPLPSEIALVQAEMAEHARSYGLDSFPTIFEILPSLKGRDSYWLTR